MVLFSPQIADDYRTLYSGPSIIASQLRNAPICRDNPLVYLGTTSLYAHGSSQYQRIRLPAGVISDQQSELRYQYIGLSTGYGTLQFMAETTRTVEEYFRKVRNFQDVNSIFGEGPSPKLRRLVAGLRELGFPPDTLTRHNRQRLIYAAELASQARDFLNARAVELPDYLVRPQDFLDATERVAAFWRKRWLASRLRHVPSMNALLEATPWQLSDHIPSANPSQLVQESSAPLKSELTAMKEDDFESDTFHFWRELAASGPRTTSDSMSTEDLARIHIELALESFLTESIRNGISVFLTGNAGDGKTHLLRKLAPVLRECGAVVVEDATALMRHDQINPVLDRWRQAVASQAPFCIGINDLPRPKTAPRLDRVAFKILKRAFYFENENGKACFDLEDTDASDFRNLLRRHHDDDPVATHHMIEAIIH